MAIVRRADKNESNLPQRRSREWDPFETMRELMGWDPYQEMFPRLARSQGANLSMPAFDVKETKDAYMFKADLPGFRDEDVDVNVTGNRLTVSGKREAEQVEDTDTYYCSERSYGTFSRTFTLPDGVDAERIDAELKDGVLSLKVPKTAEAQPKRISLRRILSGDKDKKEEASS